MNKQYVQFGAQAETVSVQPNLPDDAPMQDRIIDVLRQVYDPEIPVNLYDLGLIYELNIDSGNDVEVIMTLTTPHCPVAESMPRQVKQAVQTLSGVGNVDVQLTWDPPWSQDNMSDEARLALGLF